MSKESQTVYSESEWKIKKTERFFTNFFVNAPFRFMARKIVNQIYIYPITPNMISILGIFIVAIGGIILISSNESNSWRAIPFFLAISLFAALDGTLARKKKIFSPFGSWIGMFSERLEYMIMSIAFSWYIYSVTHDYLSMFCCILTYVFREGIGTMTTLTIGKMPTGWNKLYSEEYFYQNNKLIKFAVKSFFYTGTTYVILVCTAIIFPSNFLLLVFMFVYAVSSYIISLLVLGKKIYGVKS